MRLLCRRVAAAAAASATASVALAQPKLPKKLRREAEEGQKIENWSATHAASPAAYFSPDDADKVQHLVDLFHSCSGRLRAVGSALSPNGLGLSDEAMMSMAQLDKVIDVDRQKAQVTVQAGARVSDVVEALRWYGLTLQNYASISEQQIGGFMQAGAHGTGAAIPPVDEQIISFTIHTPGLGKLTLTEGKCAKFFHLARVGLGWLGVVSEATLQCVPAHKLIQHTFVETRDGIKKRHEEFLKHKHMRYMWIPYTDSVVVVTCDEYKEGDPIPTIPAPKNIEWKKFGLEEPVLTPELPLRSLLLKKAKAAGASMEASEVDGMSFAQLRGALLDLAPLDKAHVKEVNQAEAKFWKASEGYRVDWSDKILGFECGGQQWVSEVAFPCGTLSKPDGRDLEYMSELLEMVEATPLAVPAPIEQRWSARSKSTMSPAHSKGEDDIHSWVGIIMYLPTEGEEQRAAITETFWGEYNKMCREKLWPKYDCHQHWAKIELPSSQAELEAMRSRLADRYPLQNLWVAKQKVDPKGVLGNTLIDTLLLPAEELADFQAGKKRGTKRGFFNF